MGGSSGGGVGSAASLTDQILLGWLSTSPWKRRGNARSDRPEVRQRFQGRESHAESYAHRRWTQRPRNICVRIRLRPLLLLVVTSQPCRPLLVVPWFAQRKRHRCPLSPLWRVIEPDGNPTGNTSTNWHQMLRYFRGLGSGAAPIMGVCFTSQMLTANVRFGSKADTRTCFYIHNYSQENRWYAGWYQWSALQIT